MAADHCTPKVGAGEGGADAEARQLAHAKRLMMMSMIQNQGFMQGMMDQPQFREQMIQQMRMNHDLTQGMIMRMMDDPMIRTQMIGHMFENEEFMRQVREAMEAMEEEEDSPGMGPMP